MWACTCWGMSPHVDADPGDFRLKDWQASNVSSPPYSSDVPETSITVSPDTSPSPAERFGDADSESIPSDITSADSSAERQRNQSELIATHLLADKVSLDDNVIVAEGNVTITIEQASLMCDCLTLDRLTGNVTASGDCLLYWKDNYVSAEWLCYDPHTRSFSIHNARGLGNDFNPSGDDATGDVYFWADTMTWSPEKAELFDATITSCDKSYGDLDYHIHSDRITYYPNERVIADKMRLYIKNRLVLTMPSFNFRLNNDRRMERSIMPQIGNNSTDGFFVRANVPYSLGHDHYGSLLLGYYTKTGIGAGLEHCYRFSNKGQGVAYYYRQGGDSLNQRYEVRNNVYYDFDDENRITWDFKANKSELPNQVPYKYISSSLNFRHQTEKDRLLFSHNYSSSNENAHNTNWRLYYNLNLTPELSAMVNADISQTVTSRASADRLHYSAGLRHVGSLFDSELMFENTNGDSFYHINRNPELTLRSHPVYLGELPLQGMVSFGNVTECPSMVSTTRTEASLQVPNKVFDYGSGKFLVGAGLRQVFYGTGHAQYALASQAGWMQHLGDMGTIRFDYNWLQPTGETPLQHDLMVPYSNVTGGLEFFDEDKLNFSVVTGYNIRADKFQNVTPRLIYKPDSHWRVTLASNYDPNSSKWRAIDTGLTLQLAKNFSVSHWSVYDTINNRFTYQDYQVNYEAHDWISSIIYRGVQKEIFFQFSIKAFDPINTTVGPDGTKPVLPKILPHPFKM